MENRGDPPRGHQPCWPHRVREYPGHLVIPLAFELGMSVCDANGSETKASSTTEQAGEALELQVTNPSSSSN